MDCCFAWGVHAPRVEGYQCELVTTGIAIRSNNLVEGSPPAWFTCPEIPDAICRSFHGIADVLSNLGPGYDEYNSVGQRRKS